MITIGPYSLNGYAVLAPMAGVTDMPFRQVCLKMGAAMATGEMTSSNPRLRTTTKSKLRETHSHEAEPRTVQIVGTNAEDMANAAAYHVKAGAQIIDINMGCPAKKVCKKLAGSALMKDERLVSEILTTVVNRVDVPVTLKIRTGWDTNNKNAVSIAKLAEQAGIQSLVVHGRTRACKFMGDAEYDTIASVVNAVKTPVIANGDINSALKAQQVINKTGAAGVMIGRAAQGKPWIFSEINALLTNSEVSCALFNCKSLNLNDANSLGRLIINHLLSIYRFYDHHSIEPKRRNGLKIDGKSNNLHPNHGIKVARKHICWYFEQLKHVIAEQHLKDRNKDRNDYAVSSYKERMRLKIDSSRKQFNELDSQAGQLDYLKQFFWDLRTTGEIAA